VLLAPIAVGQTTAPKTTAKNAEKEASKNITLMLIITSFIYIMGTLPSRIGRIVLLFYPSAPYQGNFNIAAVLMLYCFPGIKLIVFISFNKLFREQFLEYLKLFKR
jgi:hypothetical protein